MESPEYMAVGGDVNPILFHVIEKQATAWNIPVYYDDLKVIGAGRFGQVWYAV